MNLSTDRRVTALEQNSSQAEASLRLVMLHVGETKEDGFKRLGIDPATTDHVMVVSFG